MQHSLEEEERAFQACAARGPARPRLLAAAPAALAEPAVHHRPAHRPSAGAHECPRRRRLVCGRSLALKTLQALEISPEKNVAAALDASGRLVVVDLEEDEE